MQRLFGSAAVSSSLVLTAISDVTIALGPCCHRFGNVILAAAVQIVSTTKKKM